MAPLLTTSRLILRPWRDGDLTSFARLNADPQVMEHFPAPLTEPESDALAARIREGLTNNPFGLWAVEIPGEAEFIGFTGLSRPTFTTHFTPCIEVGWRLAKQFWGNGYATEAAIASLDYAFRDLKLAEIVAFTIPANKRSRAVMERLSMHRDPKDDFDHPSLPKDHPLHRHVLYRVDRAEWLQKRQAAD